MQPSRNSRLIPIQPGVVGTVHSADSLRVALRLPAGAIDWVELRVDAFAPDPAPLLRAAPRLKIPRIVTVRHPAEGGAHGLSTARRRALYLEFLPHAAWLDLELRSVEMLGDVVLAARTQGVRVVLSSHDFRRTPSVAQFRQRIRRAHRAGADVCKIATFIRTPADLARLLSLLARPAPIPLAVMGMGPLGKLSRLLLARCGSVLNYGYLHLPNASGQWAARELKSRLREL